MKNNFLNSSLTNINSKASSSSEVLSQILYGEKFRILNKKKNWVRIQTSFDRYKGFITIGCAIKGKTDHYDLITNATFISLSYLSIIGKKPIGNGIITAKNKRQASERIISKSKEAFKVIKTLI